MQRLFFGIYGAILASTLLVLAGAYYALASVNQYRYQSYLEEVLEGTAVLLSKGVARQENDSQERWISLASTLLNANMTAGKSDVVARESYSVTRLPKRSNSHNEKYLASFQAANDDQKITLEFEGITEHILSATAFFMLNELGRLPVSQRQPAFDGLSAQFNYDVYRIGQADLEIDSRQLERLQRGETVVAIQRQLGRSLAFNVYAPWGNSNDALVLGPIAFFDPFPTYIAATILATALLFLAALVMLIITKLGKRLMALQDKVDAISPEYTEPQPEPLPGTEDAEVISVLGSKIQHMAQRIEKLLDEKAYMIRAVSHDLRTPIAKLHFRLEALSDKLGADHKLLRGCHDDLRQLNLLIDELLTYEKLSIKHNIEFKPVDLAKVIESQVAGLKVIHPALAIDLPCIAGNSEIEGNEVLLQRLFENLLHNAGRHAKQRITLSMQACSSYVAISIDDDGEGLQEALIPQLFDPFFRVDDSRTARKGGYGLGLAIVKQVVMQHNGEVSASNNEQGGARFTLTLPRRQDL